MIIRRPQISALLDSGQVQVSAQIEMNKGRKNLWFRFPQEFSEDLSSDPDPFVVALILVAMKNAKFTGEPLEIEGKISKKLLEGLQGYQKIYQEWFPGQFKRVEIWPTGLNDDEPPRAQNQAGCAFSGGVDSFYTFLQLEKKTPRPITHTLFMAGFDMPKSLLWSIGELTSSYAELMKEKKIHFISGATNLREWVDTVDWTNAHGQALAGSALFFKNIWSGFYIPSSYTHGTYPKWGSHPELDHLLSTQTFSFYHHGAEANRVEKLATIIQAPESYTRLRVCWIQDIGLKNCGCCEKCVRTLIALEILGASDKYTTFVEKLDGRKIRSLNFRTHQARLFAKELVSEALRRRRFGIALNLIYGLMRRRLSRISKRFHINKNKK